MFNHFGTVSAIIGVWFGAVCVFGAGDPGQGLGRGVQILCHRPHKMDTGP